MTYAAGLIMCFQCVWEPSLIDLPRHAEKNASVLALVDHLKAQVRKTPLEIFASLFLENEALAESARKLFDAYDRFLTILDDVEQRDRLDKLGQEEVADDATYQKVRELSHQFQEALNGVFLSPEHHPTLYELSKTYGMF